VRREQRLFVGREVLFASVEQAVDPRQELLRGVIGVEHDRDAVGFGDAAHERRAGERTGDAALFALVVEELAAEEGAAAVRELNDEDFMPSSLMALS